MKLLSLALALVFAACAQGYIADHVPAFPQPQRLETGAKAREVAQTIALAVDGGRCSTGECAAIVSAGFERVVRGALRSQTGLARWRLSLHEEVDAVPPPVPTSGLAALTTLRVAFMGNGDVLPPLTATDADDEWHDVTVGASGDAVLRAHTAWGVLRGFETFAQLCEWDDANARFAVGRLPLVVEDWPRFAWRGLMVDVSRHFLPLAKLLQVIDAAATMKLNVVHLHLSDAQSFPLAVDSVVGLNKGAFSPNAVYTHDNITALVAFARARGVLVVPEIDVPAHTAAWRFAAGDIVADCFDYARSISSVYSENILALNPASTKTWETIDKVLAEIASSFTGPYTHVGGDEVYVKCWENAKQKAAIRAWMTERGLASYDEVERFFNRYAQNASEATGKRPIVWEDSYTAGNLLSKDPIVHVWRQKATLAKVVRDGYDAVLSAGYYLDRQAPTCDDAACKVNWMFSWTARDMYKFDPVADLGLSAAELKHVLGGEAAMWGESIDQTNFDAMALTRLVAVAERFWSSANVTDCNNLEVRTQRFRCLSLRRGISGAGSLSSDYCEYKWPFPAIEAGPQQTPLLQQNKNNKNAANTALIAVASAFGGFMVTALLGGTVLLLAKKQRSSA